MQQNMLYHDVALDVRPANAVCVTGILRSLCTER